MSLSPIHAGLIGTALALAGCSTPGNQSASQLEARPVAATRHGIGHADAHYALGRYYQGQIRYDEAIRSYQDVLDAAPDHADAHNALGVIYAIQGRRALAEQELRAALAKAPGAAHIHNNLGYAFLLQGRAAEAIVEFEEALRLDPAYPRAADNLRVARAELEGRPQERLASPEPVPRTPPMAAQPAAPLPQPGTAPAPQLSRVADNVYELRPPEPSPALRLASDKAAFQVPSQPGTVRLEVTNGNGVEGQARRTSLYLRDMGYGVAHVTNQKPYRQRQTEIQYRPGFEQQAMGLQAALAGKGVAAPTSRLRQGVEVRLVLGHDLRQPPSLAEGEGEKETVQLAAVQR
ncbi:MAG: pilus assembly protein TadD [Rhodocyclaceae bacterium]|nr:pilus assembly protein TadD [Rhodocyclaceae bacterium]